MYNIQIFDCNLVSAVLLRGFRKPDFALEVGRPSDRGSNQKLSVSAARTDKNIMDKCSPVVLPMKMLRYYSLQKKQKSAHPSKRYFRS